jgi:hypothetical protein
VRSALRRIQYALLVLLVAWVAVHTVWVWRSGWSAWRLGGMGMYAVPTRNYSAAVIVLCRGADCRSERRHAARFAGAVREAGGVPVLRARPAAGDFEVVNVDDADGEEALALRRFELFPREDSAEHFIVTMLLRAECGPYLAVHYRQRVSLIRRVATIETRAFEVTLEGDMCAPPGSPR